jgi:hypothetical protein
VFNSVVPEASFLFCLLLLRMGVLMLLLIEECFLLFWVMCKLLDVGLRSDVWGSLIEGDGVTIDL